MADNLTNTAEAAALDWLHGTASVTRPTAPLKLRLMTVNGSDSAAGTEVVGGTYTPQTVAVTAGTSTPTNTGDLAFTLMPSCTVVGGEIWDSAVVPVRIWYGPLTSPQVVNAGGTVVILAGELDLSLS